MKKILLLCTLLFSIAYNAAAQDTEFWFVAPDVAEAHSDSPVFFVFSNPSKTTANVRIDIYAGAAPGVIGRSETFTIASGSYYKLDFTQVETRTQIENPTIYAGNIGNYGIHIQSDVKILAYYMVNGGAQRDIYSLKGKPALGKHFITPFQEHAGEYFEQRVSGTSYDKGADQIDIVATEDGTVVTAILTKKCIKHDGTSFASGTHIFPSMLKGQTLTLREDTIGVSSTAIGIAKNTGTLAGTTITANKLIAVTTSEDCLSAVSFPRNSGSTDLAGDQIVPVDMVGKRYVVIQGWSTVGERVDFTATANNTVIDVHYFNGGVPQTVSSGTLNANDTWHVDMTRLGGSVQSNIFVDATEPIYCYQHSGVVGELGAAIIPSMYSISQKQIDLYQSNGNGNYIFLVFRADCDTAFTISYDGGGETRLDAVTTITSQKIPSGIADEWRYARVTLPIAGLNRMVTIRNTESTFSLGYFNDAGSTASYGYLSGFGGFSFDPDTIWRCADNPRPVTLAAGYAKSYKWTLPDGSFRTTPSVRAHQPGMYILEMDQDPRLLIDTCWIMDVAFTASIKREPAAPKPPKVGVPQRFSVDTKITDLNYHWTFDGGTPSTSTAASASVVWNSTGSRKVTLHLSVSRGDVSNSISCDTTIVMDLQIKPKNNGYFVDQNVGGGLHDGSDWDNAFPTVQEALELASQGDYIWVAQGEYAPPSDQTYLINYDSVQIYGGFNGSEDNLNKRNINAHPTILNGRNNSVVTFDGSTQYGNYPGARCGLSTATVLDGFIIQNGRATNGAGILFTNGGTATIANCVIRQNAATEKGGGIYMEAPTCNQGHPILTTLEISGNTAVQGAGIYNAGSDFAATHITVGGNQANAGGGLYNAAGNPEIRNTIIWGNRDASTNEKAMDITVAAGTPGYTYSDIGGSNGSGGSWNTALGTDRLKNIDVKPLYRLKGFDESEVMQEGNYRLSGDSKAVNKGSNALVSSGHHLLWNITLLTPTDAAMSTRIPADLDGLDRISYDIVDMGAYEYYEDAPPPIVQREVYVPVHPYLTTDPEAGTYHVRGRENFRLTLIPKKGYSLKTLDIITGSIFQDELGNKEVIHNEDGSITIIFHEVTEPLNIQISGVSPVGNEAIDSSYALWTENNQLHVHTTKAGTLKVYSITGAVIKQQELTAGDATVSLPQGVYIVTFNDGLQQKVVVK